MSRGVEALREPFARLRASAFGRALDAEVDAVLALPGTPDSYREAIARLRGREVEHLHQRVLPALEPDLRERFLDEALAGDPRTEALLLAALVAMPTHRGKFVAAEIVKAEAVVERRVLADAIASLAPRSWYRAHLGASRAEALAREAPAAFGEARDVDAVRAAVGALEVAARRQGGETERAWRAHSTLVASPTAFDYGCGAGALMETFAGQFGVEGGDLFEGRPCDPLHRVLAVLRTVPGPDDALDASGRIASPRVVTLDACPALSSPPHGSHAVVTSIGVLEHVMEDAQLEAVLRKTFSLVAPGGVLLLNANPTMLGHDGHHELSPWAGIILHRWHWLARRAFAGRWRDGFCRRVPLDAIRRVVSPDAAGIRYLWPDPARARERLGAVAPVALPVLRSAARHGLAPVHYLAVTRRLAPESA